MKKIFILVFTIFISGAIFCVSNADIGGGGISAPSAGSTSLITVGTVTTGTWNAGNVTTALLSATTANVTTGNFATVTASSSITGLKSIINGSANVVLTATQVSDTVISNTGQGVNDVNHTLPTAAAGYHFKAIIGETQGAKYWRFTRSGSDTIIADGTAGKTYINEASPSQGDAIEFYTLQVASTGIKTGAALAIGSAKAKIANGAFTFDIAGTGYAKTAGDTTLDAATTAQNKYGAQALDIGADGTIDATPCTNIAAGLDSAVLAIADLPAVEAAHTRIGYVTAMNSAVGGFVWATTEFDVATVTEAYTSSTAYTKPYVWIATPIKGTWATD